MWCPKNKRLKPNTLGPHGPIRRSPNGPMKRRKQLNKKERKRKREREGEGDGRPEGRKEKKRENGALAPLFILLYRSLLYVYLPIYLVRNQPP